MTLPTPASATQPAPHTLTVVMTMLVCVSNPVEVDVGMYCQYRFQPGEWTNGKKRVNEDWGISTENFSIWGARLEFS